MYVANLHDALIRAHDEITNVIETQAHSGEFKGAMNVSNGIESGRTVVV